MARRLFFVDQIERGRAEVRGDNAYHMTRVLRVEPGHKYEISDNESLYLAEVASARKDLVSFHVLEQIESRKPTVHITLLASLIKFDRFEWILEKATELGVSAIAPVEAERSERGLERAADKRMERWRRILVESAQQSRRARLPELTEPLMFTDALRQPAAYRYLLDERPAALPILDTLPATRRNSDAIALLLGPEGGWADHEHAAAVDQGWRAVSLGPNILRAETAAVAALAIVSAAWANEAADERG